MNKYTVITGYWAGEKDQFKQEFFDIWYQNTIEQFPDASDLFVINHNSLLVPKQREGKWINLSHNIGHVGDLIDKRSNSTFCGWSLSVMQGMVLSALNNTDMIFKEQDCLSFGNVKNMLYSEIGEAHVITGNKIYANNQALEQSLFLIKNESIMSFLGEWLKDQRSDAYRLPESKWGDIKDRNDSIIKYLSFGYGRSRAFNWEDLKTLPFFLQQINSDDLANLRKIGLL